jgi:hypothetical protein
MNSNIAPRPPGQHTTTFNLFPRNPDRGEQRKATVENATAIFGSYRKACQNAVKKREDSVRLLGLCFDAVLTFVASYCAWIVTQQRTKVIVR